MFYDREGRFPDHYSHSMGLPRVNITQPARDMADRGFKKPDDDLISPKRRLLGLLGQKDFNPSPEEALELYHLGKAERYALTANAIAGVVDTALAYRSHAEPYGLIGHQIDWNTWEPTEGSRLEAVKWIAVPEPFRLLDMHMQTTLSVACEVWLDHMKTFSQKQPKHPQSQVYKRLKQWEEFYHKFLPLTPVGSVNLGEDTGVTFNPVFTETGTGIETAVRFMGSMLRAVPKVLEKDIPWQEITPDVVADTAKNSYPLIAKAAMMPFDVQPVLHSVLSNEVFQENRMPCHGNDRRDNPYYRGYFDPMNFVTKKTKDGYRVDMRDSTMERVEYYMGRTKGSGQKVTVGCPAMVDVNGSGSSVQKLWDWHVDIGRKLYHDLWNSWIEPQAARQARIDVIRTEAHKRGMLVMGLDF